MEPGSEMSRASNRMGLVVVQMAKKFDIGLHHIYVAEASPGVHSRTIFIASGIVGIGKYKYLCLLHHSFFAPERGSELCKSSTP